jgi:deazaflavin-dependent oxidoreductase (nitroreductase family)
MKYLQFLLNQMRFLNKWVFNPVILTFAGSPHSPISIIRHIGRRSGTLYSTPVIVEPLSDGFMFALPYGIKVDWYRNLQAAGRGTVMWHGKEYQVEKPQILFPQTDTPALPFALRLIVRIVGEKHFIRMPSSRLPEDPATTFRVDGLRKM